MGSSLIIAWERATMADRSLEVPAEMKQLIASARQKAKMADEALEVFAERQLRGLDNCHRWQRSHQVLRIGHDGRRACGPCRI